MGTFVVQPTVLFMKIVYVSSYLFTSSLDRKLKWLLYNVRETTTWFNFCEYLTTPDVTNLSPNRNNLRKNFVISFNKKEFMYNGF